MAQSVTIPWPDQTAVKPVVPWYIWACTLAVTSASFGGVWDISWHESIGRDTFWTAPHLFIHFGGILAGAASAWLIFYYRNCVPYTQKLHVFHSAPDRHEGAADR